MTGIKEFFAAIPDVIKTYVMEPLSQIKPIDFIDIIILTLLFFFVYRFIRNRRAGKLALGLVLLLFIMIIASLFNMRAIGFILQNFYQVGIIAILIVFQPELRAALEKVGNTSIITGIKNITSGEKRQYMSQIENAVTDICDAVFEMSSQKVGALIVIERTTKLGDYIDTGIKLNAQISSDLLKNIFFKNAPLHDGAVIISNMQITAAACFLRISEQEGIDSDLGTRHRAAIGITEVSDAVVIVVSEETGKVSIAKDSKIFREYTKEKLKKELLGLLATKKALMNRIKADKEVKADE